MCLDTMDLKAKKHKVGYKICRKKDDGFKGNIFDTGPYYLGETYSAIFDQDALPEIHGGNGVHYLAGFHYYRKMKDAKCVCGENEIVIRILVEGVLASGTQNGYDAGVAEIMTLDRIILDGEQAKLKREKEAHKKFLRICNGGAQLKILKFAKKFGLTTFLVKATDMKEIADFMTETIERFVDFIAFVDCFPRQSKTFKILTKFHLWAFENHDPYKNFYHYVVKGIEDGDDLELRKKLGRHEDYEVMLKEATNIDEFVLNNI